MRVLVLEDEQHAADVAQKELVDAGVDVVRCNHPDDPQFPCAGMPGGPGCPIETTTVDVTLTVGPRTDVVDVGPGDGVRCSMRHHIPVVATGGDQSASWRGLVANADGTEVVDALREAADAPLRRHGEVATAELRNVLVRKGIDAPEAIVVVSRHAGGLAAALEPGVDVPDATLQAAGVRVAAALRALDDKSVAVDVTIASRDT